MPEMRERQEITRPRGPSYAAKFGSAAANSFHIALKDELFKSGKFLDQESVLFQIPYHEAYDVNDPSDIRVAEALYQSRERIWSYEK